MSKKKIIIICSLVLVIGAGLFITIHSINNFASTSEEELLNSDNKTLEVEESNVILDEDIEEDKLLEDTTEITESSDNGTSNESNNSSTKTDTSNNSSSNNSSNNSSSNSTTSSNTTTSESDTTTSTDTSTTDTSSSASSYIGVPYPYDFNYSYHHGVIEYSSTEACLADVPDIAFKDTVDIINIDCLDVVDGTGTVLGVYMYINCTSGNCNKYK